MPPAANVSPARLRRLHDILRDLPKDASTNALYDGVCQVELSDPCHVFQLLFSRGSLDHRGKARFTRRTSPQRRQFPRVGLLIRE